MWASLASLAGHQNRKSATARKLARAFFSPFSEKTSQRVSVGWRVLASFGQFWYVGEFSRRFGFDFGPLPENPRNFIEIRSCAQFFFGSPKAEGKTPKILKTGCRLVGAWKRGFGGWKRGETQKILEIPSKFARAPSFFVPPGAEKATPILF